MNLDPESRFKIAGLQLRIWALKYRAFARREPGSRAGVLRKRRLLDCVSASLRISAVEARRARREAHERRALQPDGSWLDAKRLLG
jgi:hypothetical protein